LSGVDSLLVFVGPLGEAEGWLLVEGDRVARRGDGLDGLPPLADPESGGPLRIVAVVPGEEVAVHWLELPAGLAPAQALVAARMAAADLGAEGLADLHVALGGETEGSGLRAVALTPALRMTRWIEQLQAHGLDPDAIVPEPLLLVPPEQGFARFARGDVPLYRAATEAFSIEPELAAVIVGDGPVTELDRQAFEDGIAPSLAAMPVDLRQGVFAKRRRWKIEWPWVRRIAALAIVLLAVTLAIQLASILRYTYAADALEAETQEVAVSVLPPGTNTADPARRLAERVADLRGSGAGYTAITSALFAAVRATAGVELGAFTFERDGSLRVAVLADTPANVALLQQRIQAAGFATQAGQTQSAGGRPMMEMTVRAR
jgi:general secretion pathway protein L